MSEARLIRQLIERLQIAAAKADVPPEGALTLQSKSVNPEKLANLLKEIQADEQLIQRGDYVTNPPSPTPRLSIESTLDDMQDPRLALRPGTDVQMSNQEYLPHKPLGTDEVPFQLQDAPGTLSEFPYTRVNPTTIKQRTKGGKLNYVTAYDPVERSVTPERPAPSAKIWDDPEEVLLQQSIDDLARSHTMQSGEVAGRGSYYPIVDKQGREIDRSRIADPAGVESYTPHLDIKKGKEASPTDPMRLSERAIDDGLAYDPVTARTIDDSDFQELMQAQRESKQPRRVGGEKVSEDFRAFRPHDQKVPSSKYVQVLDEFVKRNPKDAKTLDPLRKRYKDKYDRYHNAKPEDRKEWAANTLKGFDSFVTKEGKEVSGRHGVRVLDEAPPQLTAQGQERFLLMMYKRLFPNDDWERMKWSATEKTFGDDVDKANLSYFTKKVRSELNNPEGRKLIEKTIQSMINDPAHKNVVDRMMRQSFNTPDEGGRKVGINSSKARQALEEGDGYTDLPPTPKQQNIQTLDEIAYDPLRGNPAAMYNGRSATTPEMEDFNLSRNAIDDLLERIRTGKLQVSPQDKEKVNNFYLAMKKRALEPKS